MMRCILSILLGIICTTNALAVDYYVDPANGNNANSGLSIALAKQSIQAASNLTMPGDNVFLMNGNYHATNNANQSIVTITRSGTEGRYITYKAYPGHKPKLQLQTGLNYQVWRAIGIEASYIIIDGIEIEGTNQSLTYDGAYEAWQNYEKKMADWNAVSMYNCGSITIGQGSNPHHIIVRNCNIHDTGGGIGAFNSDYITAENNIIYNNCWYSMYAGSGFSILDPRSVDNVTGYKMFVRNNIVYGNKTLIPWERIDALSDGNGIILDVNIGNGTTTVPYVGRYLIENNVVYSNGGGGIHAYKAAHIDIINNTAYNNGTVVGYPEIDANQCSDVKIYNNIMYARTGGNCNGNDANTIYDYNLYFNGPFFKKGPHDISGVNPEFMNLSTDPLTADFRLKNISPAINNGSNTTGQFSPKDILGVSRPVGFSTDMGAYEYATVIPRTEIALKQGDTEIIDNTGTFDFGDVSSTAPKTVTFTIQNIGDQVLNLSGTPKVVTTGTGFSVSVDAPASVAANGSATFQVTLTTTATPGVYNGTVSIANDDADENPYNFAITGYGYDGNKVLQTITFNPIPTKIIGVADFDAGASSSASLPITYTSSNTNVATIVAGKIHVVNSGTSTITASQAGDASTNVAKEVTQLLTVTPVLPPPGTNLISNPTFDVNTTGWTFSNKNSATSTVESIAKTGFTTNVGKVNITSIGTSTGTDNVQLSTNIFLVNGKNYQITFRASADAARNISVQLLRNSSPFSTIYSKGTPVTTTPTKYGSYAFTSNFTGSVAFRFFLGGNLTPVYLDDVEIIEEPQAPPTITAASKSGSTVTITGTGFIGATDVSINNTPATAFTIVSGTSATATTSQTTLSTVKITTDGGTATYTVPANANLSALTTSAGALSPAFASGTLTYTAPQVSNSTGTVTITPVLEDNLATVTVNGVTTVSGSAANVAVSTGSNAIPIVVAAQNGTTKTYTVNITKSAALPPSVLTFTLSAKTFGNADFSPGATSTNTAMPITYTSDNAAVATIVNGQIHIVSSGTANITASQAGNANFDAAANVVAVLTVNKASQTITFNAIPVQKVKGTLTLSPTSSSGLPVTLASSNTIVATVNALSLDVLQEGTSNITATQAGNANYLPATAIVQVLTVKFNSETVKVTAGVSPNGDGVNDHLVIDNISSYSDNKLTIVSKNGVTVFESSGYNNTSNVFDGRSKKSNEYLPAGTYYYMLTYTADGAKNKKTGYIILKY